MKNFIVPIDFSNESLNGLKMAILFSTKQEVNIQMVHVMTPSSDYQPGIAKDQRKKAEEHLAKLVKEYSPQLGNSSKLRSIVKEGKVYKEIISQVNSYKDSVVSTSTHGASGFEELFAGSNALKIMSATHNPVITIRNSPIPQKIKRIIVPIKLHPDTRQKLPVVAQLAKLFEAEVHVVAIATKNNKRDIERINSYSHQSVGYLKSNKIHSIQHLVTGDSLPVLTLNYAEAVGGDLIVMMSSAIDKWNVLFGSYAQQMLNKSHLPLVSIKPRPTQLPSGFSTFG